MVHQMSRKYGVPFSTQYTDSNRLSYVYCCTFGGDPKNTVRETCKSIYKCPAKLIFIHVNVFNTDYFSFSMEHSTIQHSHPATSLFAGAFRNILTTDQIAEVNNQENLGVLPGINRTNNNVNVNSNIYFNIRREARKKVNTESLESFIDEILKPMIMM